MGELSSSFGLSPRLCGSGWGAWAGTGTRADTRAGIGAGTGAGPRCRWEGPPLVYSGLRAGAMCLCLCVWCLVRVCVCSAWSAGTPPRIYVWSSWPGLPSLARLPQSHNPQPPPRDAMPMHGVTSPVAAPLQPMRAWLAWRPPARCGRPRNSHRLAAAGPRLGLECADMYVPGVWYISLEKSIG